MSGAKSNEAWGEGGKIVQLIIGVGRGTQGRSVHKTTWGQGSNYRSVCREKMHKFSKKHDQDQEGDMGGGGGGFSMVERPKKKKRSWGKTSGPKTKGGMQTRAFK